MYKLLLGLAAGLSMIASATAFDFGPIPANYGEAAKSYLAERMDNVRGVRMEVVSAPYQVMADVSGHYDLPCWAVDLRVKSRLPGGGYGSEILTVVFLGETPVALKQDAARLVRA